MKYYKISADDLEDLESKISAIEDACPSGDEMFEKFWEMAGKNIKSY